MKKSRIINFGLVISCVILLGAQLGFCADTFQNSLLKADISKSPLGGLKLTLFTSKPYNDSIVVNKKSDFEYVILMPETSNSMTAQPSLKLVDDTVKGIEVKTQQYADKVKGYTKIVVSTTKPIEIISHVQTLASSDYKLGENDYKQLLAQAKVTPNKKEATKPSSAGIKKSAQVPVSSPVKAKAQEVTKKVKEIAKSVEQKVSQKQAPAPKVVKVVEKAPTSTVASSVKKTEQKIVEVKPAVVTQEIEPKEAATKKVEEVSQEPAIDEKTATVESAKTSEKTDFSDFKSYKALIKEYFYALVGAAFALFILLLLGARKLNKNNAKQKEIFTTHLEEKPETVVNFEEIIEDDMTWQEKFQTYVDTTQAQQEPKATEPELTDIQENAELDDLFSDEIIQDMALEENVSDEEEPLFADEESYETDDVEAIFEDEASILGDFSEVIENKEDSTYENASLDELFGTDEIEEDVESDVEVNAQESINEGFFAQCFDDDQSEDVDIVFGGEEEETEAEDENVVKSEFAIDDEKGFYLVDFENTTALVGHIEEEIFVLKRFDVRVNAPITARLNERKAIGASYMIKVAGYRALVDVSPNNMSLLIEL